MLYVLDIQLTVSIYGTFRGHNIARRPGTTHLQCLLMIKLRVERWLNVDIYVSRVIPPGVYFCEDCKMD